MKLPYRRAITSLSEDHMVVLFSKRFGMKGDEHLAYGLGVGPGWNDILYDLNKKLEAEKPDYKILQIKEKFGGLRFYTDELPYSGWDAIKEAEELSFKTCEECGRPGKIWSGKGWLRTLCWLDYRISEINKTLWFLQRKGLSSFFKTYFYVRRLRREFKRKGSAKNGI